MKLKNIFMCVGAAMLAVVMSSCGTTSKKAGQTAGVTIHGSNYGSVSVGQQSEYRKKSPGSSYQRSSTAALAGGPPVGPPRSGGPVAYSSTETRVTGGGTRYAGKRQVGVKREVVWHGSGELVDIHPLAKPVGGGTVRRWEGMPEHKGELIDVWGSEKARLEGR